MGPRPKSEFRLMAWMIALGIWAVLIPLAFASHPAPSGAVDPCAVISDYSGSIQILNTARTELLEATRLASVPCGGWISVGSGWVILKHREGFSVHLGAGSFAQVVDGTSETKALSQGVGDTLLLFKGEVYGKVATGTASLQLMTANGRVRLNQGSILLIYDPASEFTQLVTLEGEAVFENRFQSARKMIVKAGEVSELNLKQFRVVPSTPRAASIASLKPRFDELSLSEKERDIASQNILSRIERKFASAEALKREAEEPTRRPAGLEVAPARPTHAGKPGEADAEGEAEGAAIQAKFIQKLAGGQKVGEDILYPTRFQGKYGPAKVEVEDLARKLDLNVRRVEDREKKRLIEELSRIRIE